MKSKPLPPIPFTERGSGLDRPVASAPEGAGTEKVSARGKMLKALGAFEPVLVNDTEIERFIDKSRPTHKAWDSTIPRSKHGSLGDFRGSAGFRQAIGDARIPDLSFGNGNQQVILGGFFPLLKGS